MKQKIIVAAGPQKNVIQEADIGQLNDDQVLIRLKYVGVCRSEHDSWKEGKVGRRFGHEPLGVIEKV